MTPLTFPARKIQPIPFDVVAHAQGAVMEAVADLQFAACEAFNRHDLSALLQLHKQIRTLVDALEVTSGIALDLAGRL